MHSVIAVLPVVSEMSVTFMLSDPILHSQHARHYMLDMQCKHSVPTILRFHRNHAMHPTHRTNRMKERLSMLHMLSLTAWHCNHPRQRNTEKQHLGQQVTLWHPLAANGYCTDTLL